MGDLPAKEWSFRTERSDVIEPSGGCDKAAGQGETFPFEYIDES